MGFSGGITRAVSVSYTHLDVYKRQEDVFNLLRRIEILMQHGCLPYVMRFIRYMESPYRGVYVSIARWANQPGMFKRQSLREFAENNGRQSACYRYLADFERQFPDAAYFYDLRFVSAGGERHLSLIHI